MDKSVNGSLCLNAKTKEKSFENTIQMIDNDEHLIFKITIAYNHH